MEYDLIITNPKNKPLFDGLVMLDAYNAEWCGIRIQFTWAVKQYATKWVFPKERFWTYEPHDEQWCRPLGIGHEEETKDLLFYKMKLNRHEHGMADYTMPKPEFNKPGPLWRMMMADSMIRHAGMIGI